jgi:hypothetical protein
MGPVGPMGIPVFRSSLASTGLYVELNTWKSLSPCDFLLHHFWLFFLCFGEYLLRQNASEQVTDEVDRVIMH